jgi:formylglycine-generating enzyme required for sulfatase activity
MKKGKLSFAILIILVIIAAIISCENRFIIDILPERNKIKPEVPQEPEIPVIPTQPKAYTIVIDISDDEPGDTVTASPDSGDEGDIITLSYVVVNTKHYNLLDLGGVTSPIASVDSAGSGTRTYTVDAEDASNGVITITAVFTHTNLVPDPIAFNTDTGHINKTYGDAAFTNDITAGYLGSGAITYSSSDTTVASVDSSGRVTIHKAGSTVISAEKEADEVYAPAQKDYTLAVDPKPVTVSFLIQWNPITLTFQPIVANKQYDGTTTATVIGTAVIDGLIDGDYVSVVTGTAAFVDALVGNGKTVTFSGWSLTGTDAGNYSLSAQPASVKANIELVSMINIVQIPAGTFVMGSPTSESNRSSNETQHSVTLTKSFYMSKYQVTQEQYQAVMGTNPSNFKSAVTGESGTPGKLPVEQVSWYDALVFCNKLSMMEGLSPTYSISGSTDPAVWGTVPTDSNSTWNAVVIVEGSYGYRLPTEAQWEYACRAGTMTAYNTGDAISDNTGWYTSNSGSKTHEAGKKSVNAWGLYDMLGNVWEWCWDWYDSSYYSSSPTNDPMGASSGTNRVLRGGSWGSSAEYLRSAARDLSSPYYRGYSIGFRLVRS